MTLKESMAPHKKYYSNEISYRGITLIEMLMVIMLLSILCAVVARIYLSNAEFHKLNKEHLAILTIENALKWYKLDNGFYPSNEQGISALITKPITKPIPLHWTRYLKNVPLDLCGKSYRYVSPGASGEIEVYTDCSRGDYGWRVTIKRFFKAVGF